MKNAIVWGSSGAIGDAVVKKLIAEDWMTVGITRNREQSPGSARLEVEIKHGDAQSIQEAIYLISQEIGEIDLFCYAGGDILYDKVADSNPGDWQRILNANLTNVFSAIHYTLPLLSENAHIFVIGAVSERLRLPGLSAYAASKAGLEAFAQTLAKEQRKKLVTIVRPAAVATPFWDKVPLKMPKDAAEPRKVADKIYEAFLSGHKGNLDLV
jgi:NAD(P)-dependent dehydrogenase (short-subunit alcohol dehydrogenase family)